jgi:hypothetical protein
MEDPFLVLPDEIVWKILEAVMTEPTKDSKRWTLRWPTWVCQRFRRIGMQIAAENVLFSPLDLCVCGRLRFFFVVSDRIYRPPPSSFCKKERVCYRTVDPSGAAHVKAMDWTFAGNRKTVIYMTDKPTRDVVNLVTQAKTVRGQRDDDIAKVYNSRLEMRNGSVLRVVRRVKDLDKVTKVSAVIIENYGYVGEDLIAWLRNLVAVRDPFPIYATKKVVSRKEYEKRRERDFWEEHFAPAGSTKSFDKAYIRDECGIVPLNL